MCIRDSGKTIRWSIGDVAEPVYAGDGSLSGYTAKLRYTVYLDDEIYDAEPNEEGLFATNASAVLTYGEGQTLDFEVPAVPVTGAVSYTHLHSPLSAKRMSMPP